MPAPWSAQNPTYGMCAITALVANDIFGGEIIKLKVGEVTHFANLLNHEIVDLTADQFSTIPDYTKSAVVSRESILNPDTLNRYNVLKLRLVKLS